MSCELLSKRPRKTETSGSETSTKAVPLVPKLSTAMTLFRCHLGGARPEAFVVKVLTIFASDSLHNGTVIAVAYERSFAWRCYAD